MLRVWFGEKENSVYNTSVFFNNRYEKKWITEDFSRKIIKDVDQSEVINENMIQSPVLGAIPPEDLSGGVKTLMLLNHFPGIYFNGSNCGNNCAKCILEIGRKQNCSMALYHTMNFGKGTFEIRIMNKQGLVVHDMSEFLDASIQFLKG